jgi:hypothetical protein
MQVSRPIVIHQTIVAVRLFPDRRLRGLVCRRNDKSFAYDASNQLRCELRFRTLAGPEARLRQKSCSSTQTGRGYLGQTRPALSPEARLSQDHSVRAEAPHESGHVLAPFVVHGRCRGRCLGARSERPSSSHILLGFLSCRRLGFKRRSGTSDLELTSSSYAAEVFRAISVQL